MHVWDQCCKQEPVLLVRIWWLLCVLILGLRVSGIFRLSLLSQLFGRTSYDMENPTSGFQIETWYWTGSPLYTQLQLQSKLALHKLAWNLLCFCSKHDLVWSFSLCVCRFSLMVTCVAFYSVCLRPRENWLQAIMYWCSTLIKVNMQVWTSLSIRKTGNLSLMLAFPCEKLHLNEHWIPDQNH